MRNKTKRNLLVTLADKNYIEQAKQLFSSVYWNAGWKGDYMLLAHEISERELKWFRKKGILVKKCKKIGIDFSTKLNKFYLFTPEFKKWKNIIYLDADIIVRASLDVLTKIKGFGAVLDDFINNTLIDQFINYSQIGIQELRELKKIYSLSSKSFNSGMMAFSTGIIKDDTFSQLKGLFTQYKKLLKPGVFDQPIFNLYFYNKWKRLPLIYNLDVKDFRFIGEKKIDAIILHLKKNNDFFHDEWNFNLSRTNKINISKVRVPCKKWTCSEIKKYSLYLKFRFIFHFSNRVHFIDRYVGLIGIFLYNHFPKLYFKLKILKIKICQ